MMLQTIVRTSLMVLLLIGALTARGQESLYPDRIVDAPLPPSILHTLLIMHEGLSSKVDEQEFQAAGKKIQALNQKLAKLASDAEKAKQYKTIASLHESRFAYLIFRQLQSQKEDLDRWAALGRQGPPPSANLTKAFGELEKAANSYRHVIFDLKEKNTDPTMFFQLALALAPIDSQSSQIYLKRLIRKQEKSPISRKAELLLGDIDLTTKNYLQASKHFKAAALIDQAIIRLYARYRLAWAQWLAQPKQTPVLTDFVAVAKSLRLENAKTPITRHLSPLVQADLVKLSADRLSHEQGLAIFEELGDTEGKFDFLHRSALNALRQNNEALGYKYFDDILKGSPKRLENLNIYQVQLQQLKKGNAWEKMASALQAMFKQLGPGSPWQQFNSKRTPWIEEANKFLTKSSLDLSAQLVRIAETSPQSPLVSVALLFGRHTVISFPNEKGTTGLKVKIAKLYLRANHWEEAGQMFADIASNLPKKSDERRKMMQQALASYLKNQDQSKAKTQNSSPQNLANLERAETTLKALVEEYGVTPFSLKQRYILAESLQRNNQSVRALSHWRTLMDDGSQDKLVKLSLKSSIDVHQKLKNWDQALEFALYATKLTSQMNEPEQILAGNFHQTVAFAIAQTPNRKVDEIKSILLAFERAYPKHEKAADALVKVFRLIEKDDDLTQPFAIGAKIITDHPRHPAQGDILWTLMQMHLEIFDLERATKLASLFLKQFPSEKRSEEALWLLAYNSMLLGQNAEASKSFQDYVRRYPKSKRLPDALVYAAESSNRDGKREQSLALYQAAANLPDKENPNVWVSRSQIAILTGKILANPPTDLNQLTQNLMSLPPLIRQDAAERLSRGIYLIITQRSKALIDEQQTPMPLSSLKSQDAKLLHLTNLFATINKLSRPEYTLGSAAIIGRTFLKLSELRFAAFQSSTPKETAMENGAFAAREKAQTYLSTAQRIFTSAPYSPVQSMIYPTLETSFPKDFPEFSEEVLTPIFTESPWPAH